MPAQAQNALRCSRVEVKSVRHHPKAPVQAPDALHWKVQEQARDGCHRPTASESDALVRHPRAVLQSSVPALTPPPYEGAPGRAPLLGAAG